MKIRIAEIFNSLSGEVGGFEQGSLTLFVRLAGCNLKCPFCDTKWANEPGVGEEWEVEKLVSEILATGRKQLLITGGEPLLQKEAMQNLVYALKGNSSDIKIQIETNGTIPINGIYLVDYWVLDFKLPGAMQGYPYKFQNPVVDRRCWVKFLVGNQEDLDRIPGIYGILKPYGARFAVSSIGIDPAYLAKWVIDSGLQITLNIQLHKVIGLA